MTRKAYVGMGSLLLVAAVGIGCGDDDGAGSGGGGGVVPDGGGTSSRYEFDSRFGDGSSVSFAGQTARLAMIRDIKVPIADVDTNARDNTFEVEPASAADIYAMINRYVRSGFDEVPSIDGSPLRFTTTPPLLQSTYGQVSTSKNLLEKLAGNDTRDHADWETDFGGFVTNLPTAGGTAPATGWNPTALTDAFMRAIAELAFEELATQQARTFGTTRLPSYVDDEGRDYQQLIEKFLFGAVAFSQGADDYLDEGLSAPNTRAGEAAYTELEHAWDEGFGYFGAARDYGDYTDDEIAGASGREEYRRGYHDTDGDGLIDLTTEYIFGAASNAAKRDRAACMATDLTGDAFGAFLEGRNIIHGAGESLTAAESAALADARDRAVRAWEEAIAATALHYINDTLDDLDGYDYSSSEEGAGTYDFLNLAKHWSELKGFALSLQFNPRSPVTTEQFVELHGLIGDAPVLEAAGEAATDQYRADLEAARTLLMNAYGFAIENVEGTETCARW